MSNELDCKWHFAPTGENDGDKGPNSALSQTFAKFPCAALVRESIQNSLDAALCDDKPVIVCFEHYSLSKLYYRNFFDIADNIQACFEYYRNDKTAKAIYPKMFKYLNKTEQIGFIRVSDYNTKGMDYIKGETDKSFYAFVRAEGVVVKQAVGAGGSFGFGKGAFFVMSPINTLLVSTCNKEGKCHFEGVARLCTHKINNQKYSNMGFYDNNNGQPSNQSDQIPIHFRRKESGTSIGIMGIEYDNWSSSIDELTKEVLSNFFVAILKGKLVVYINGNQERQYDNTVIINQDTIKDLMNLHFPTTKDKNRINSFNPRPYFESITDPDASKFEKDLPILGHVEFSLKQFDDNVTQVIYMRKPLMKVFREARNIGSYNGVFICQNEVGNKILGDMEDPEHKSWDPAQCNRTEINTDYDTARKAEEEIRRFVNDCLEELLNINASDSVQVSGLEKYLPLMENEKGKGEKGNPFTGRPTGKYVKEGSSMTTEAVLIPNPTVKNDSKGIITKITSGRIKTDPKQEVSGHVGGGGKGHGGNGQRPGEHPKHGKHENGNGSYKELIEVEWRPILSAKKGFTDIVIYPPKNLGSAELQFYIGRENQAVNNERDDVTILECNRGKAEGLKITGVSLIANVRNIIQVSFSDKMSHTLKLEVYETN